MVSSMKATSPPAVNGRCSVAASRIAPTTMGTATIRTDRGASIRSGLARRSFRWVGRAGGASAAGATCIRRCYEAPDLPDRQRRFLAGARSLHGPHLPGVQRLAALRAGRNHIGPVAAALVDDLDRGPV